MSKRRLVTEKQSLGLITEQNLTLFGKSYCTNLAWCGTFTTQTSSYYPIKWTEEISTTIILKTEKYEL